MVCGVNCHPSLQLEEKLFEASIVELAKTVKVDQLILPASNDIPEVKEGGDVIKALRENGAKCEVRVFLRCVNLLLWGCKFCDCHLANQ
tara:strand:+ start:364 stop:630 length:267 start_codon:yes stop_codon:yes gene_type:complete